MSCNKIHESIIIQLLVNNPAFLLVQITASGKYYMSHIILLPSRKDDMAHIVLKYPKVETRVKYIGDIKN